MGSVGGWVFVVDVTLVGSVGKSILVRHISRLVNQACILGIKSDWIILVFQTTIFLIHNTRGGRILPKSLPNEFGQNQPTPYEGGKGKWEVGRKGEKTNRHHMNSECSVYTKGIM